MSDTKIKKTPEVKKSEFLDLVESHLAEAQKAVEAAYRLAHHSDKGLKFLTTRQRQELLSLRAYICGVEVKD